MKEPVDVFEVGDVVCTKDKSLQSTPSYTAHRIARETKTRYILENGRVYYKNNLSRMGGHHGEGIQRYTEVEKLANQVCAKHTFIRMKIYDIDAIRNKLKCRDIEKLSEIANLANKFHEALLSIKE